MKVAIYPGSFNPWHSGHTNVLEQALKVFDKVIIIIGNNPDKKHDIKQAYQSVHEKNPYIGISQIELVMYNGLLKDYIDTIECDAIIKGIRNTSDFLYEQRIQYWNEDLQIKIPTYYIISDRRLVHISSSAIRSLEKFQKE